MIPSSYQGTSRELLSVVVDARAAALYVNLLTDELYQVTGVVGVWSEKPWSTCIIASDGERYTVVEGWKDYGTPDVAPVPHPCLVAILATATVRS